ncbi:MAG: terpene cyclase/mutase family protein [Planctomycetia bacterium]|nr:terpene cyclase/mutase family protein [Planctomycetia bacterium]
MRRLLILTAVYFGLIGGSLRADEPTDAAVRDAVARSLPFLEKGGVEWMEERGCMSCHHVPFLLWSHRAAQSHGLAVDAKKLAEWDEWARKDSLANRYSFKLPLSDLEKIDVAVMPTAVKEKLNPIVGQTFATAAEFLAKLTPLLTADELQAHQALLIKTSTIGENWPNRNGGGLDVLGQLLLGGHAAADDSTNVGFRGGVVDLMKQRQLADGSWLPGNQFATMRQWSLPTANQATTMWAAIALAKYDARDQQPQKRSEQIERAIAYQRQQPPQNENREWLATRLLFEHQFGTSDEVSKQRQLLLDARNTDGGWGWQNEVLSDPYSTGIAIYVLAKVGGDHSAVFRDARKFLLMSQQADGSWLTPSKNISKTTVPERLKVRDEIYHYWGTAWAALGLLETLPASGSSTTAIRSSKS